MIVRILGEGQYEVPASAEAHLDELDATLEAAIQHHDSRAFETALNAILAAVRSVGSPLDAARIVPSDLALPAPGSSLHEVLQLLDTEADATAES